MEKRSQISLQDRFSFLYQHNSVRNGSNFMLMSCYNRLLSELGQEDEDWPRKRHETFSSAPPDPSVPPSGTAPGCGDRQVRPVPLLGQENVRYWIKHVYFALFRGCATSSESNTRDTPNDTHLTNQRGKCLIAAINGKK